MSCRRTPNSISAPPAVSGVDLAIAVATAIVLVASLLIGGLLFASADHAIIGESLTPEHGATYCPECHVGGDRK